MIIQFITLIISLFVQFGSFYITPYNDVFVSNLEACKSFMRSQGGWQSTYGNVSNDFFVGKKSGNNFIFFFPREVAESNYSSSYSVLSVDDYGFNVHFSEWVQITWSGSSNTYVWLNNNNNIRFNYPTDVNNIVSDDIIYSGSDNFYYNDNYLITITQQLPPKNDFDGHYEPTVAPENLDFTGHSNVTISNSSITTENGNITQNILGKMNNAINSLGNIVANGFNGVYSLLGQINNNIGSVFGNLFGKISYILYIPSADEIFTTFNGSLLGQNLHLFSDVENSVRDNLIITTPDNFVINFSFMFFGTNIPFVLDMNGLFGSVLMSRLRSILTAFIYVGCVLLVIYELPHTVQGLNGFAR